MLRKIYCLILFLAMVLTIAGCGGKVLYSQAAPDVAVFHPDSIAVLSIAAGGYPEARGKCEKILADALAAKKKWFKAVTKPEQLTALTEKDEALKKTLADYLEKLRTVSFSDPELSRKIGEALGVQAFIVGQVDMWHYTEEGEKKLAKVGMELRMIQAETGKTVWRANHHKIKDYMVLKPDLAGMAEELAGEIVADMPH